MRKNEPMLDAINDYLAGQHHFTPKTEQNYRQVLTEFDKWLTHPLLSDLTPANANRFIAEKRKAGKVYAARNIAAVLKRFAIWLDKERSLSGPRGSVLASVETPKVRKDGRKPFTGKETEAILRASLNGPLWARDRAAVALMLGCGLRLNEARELTLDDVDTTARVVTVRAETSKSGRTREVRLDPISQQAISTYIRDSRPKSSSRRIFLTRSGEPMEYMGFHHMFARMRLRFAKLGITDFKAHRLRHTYATAYHVQGGSLFDLQREGGWSDLSMVRKYAQNTPIAELHKRPTPLEWMLSKRTG